MKKKLSTLKPLWAALALLICLPLFNGCERIIKVVEEWPKDLETPYNGIDLLDMAYQSEILACEDDPNRKDCDELSQEREVLLQDNEELNNTFDEVFNATGLGLGPIGPRGPIGPTGPIGPPPPPSPCQCEIPWEPLTLVFPGDVEVKQILVFNERGEEKAVGRRDNLLESQFITHTLDLSEFSEGETARMVISVNGRELELFLTY
ncbi:MAG: hypothetical protein AAF804_05725 [Bacteroidota bacterium]